MKPDEEGKVLISLRRVLPSEAPERKKKEGKPAAPPAAPGSTGKALVAGAGGREDRLS